MIGRDVDGQFAAYDDELEFSASEGECWECEGLEPERERCEECGGTGLGTANPRRKWDWYRLLAEGVVVSVLAEIARRYDDESSPRVHTWALVVDGAWQDRYDSVPYQPVDSYPERLEASLPTWINHWEDAVAQHAQDAPAAFVVYHH